MLDHFNPVYFIESKTLGIAWDLCDFHKLLVCCANLIYRNLINCQLQEQVHNLYYSPLCSPPLFYFFNQVFFLVFNWFMVFRGEILISACTIISTKSVYHHSCQSQAQMLWTETTYILENCNEICLKTPKSDRNTRVFAQSYTKVVKNAQFELKNTFLFLFFVAKISLFRVHKRYKQPKTRCF